MGYEKFFARNVTYAIGEHDLIENDCMIQILKLSTEDDILQNTLESSHGKQESNFDPSMKFLSRIMKVILTKNSVVKTALSQEANINYARLAKHLDWLKGKDLVKFVIEDQKVHVVLTEGGRDLAIALSSISL